MYGARIKTERMKRGWTMERLAEKIQVAKSSVAGYEAENRQPPIDKFQKMAEVFNVSTDYLIGLTDDPDPKKEQRNVREILEKDVLHWDGKPLSPQELRPIRELLEMVVKERMPNYNQNQNYRS